VGPCLQKDLMSLTMIFHFICEYCIEECILDIIMGPSYRSCPFVCPSICLSFCGLLVTRKQKKCRKTRTGINVPQDTSKWNANFYLKRSKVKVIGCQKPPQLSSIAFIYRWSIEWRLRRRLQTRPRQMAAYHVSTRCLFLFCIWLC